MPGDLTQAQQGRDLARFREQRYNLHRKGGAFSDLEGSDSKETSKKVNPPSPFLHTNLLFLYSFSRFCFSGGDFLIHRYTLTAGLPSTRCSYK